MKRLVILLLAFAAISPADAQLDSLSSPEAHFSAFIVKDIEASISWYSNTFGFKVLNNNAYPERGFKQANLQSGHTLIELIELETALSLQEVIPNYNKKTKTIGIFKIGFLVADFDGWIRHLTAQEVNFHGGVVKDNLSGKKMVIALDPDGNRIQVFEK